KLLVTDACFVPTVEDAKDALGGTKTTPEKTGQRPPDPMKIDFKDYEPSTHAPSILEDLFLNHGGKLDRNPASGGTYAVAGGGASRPGSGSGSGDTKGSGPGPSGSAAPVPGRILSAPPLAAPAIPTPGGTLPVSVTGSRPAAPAKTTADITVHLPAEAALYLD